MKKHKIFFEKYNEITNDNERMIFMRGYMLSLSPKQLQLFFSVNAKNAINAIRDLSIGSLEDKQTALSMIENIEVKALNLKKEVQVYDKLAI